MLSAHQQAARRPRASSTDHAPPPPLASPSSSSPTLTAAADKVRSSTAHPLDAADDDDEPQQCWICYTDSTEDPSRPFIHACSCTLVAHEQCLLDWLTAQATSPQQHHPHPPRCPVCASPIVVREHRSDLLRLYRRVRRNADNASLVAAVGAVAASAWFVAAAYGAWAVRTFMGDQVARALVLRHEGGFPWRYWLNLPLIPFTLILSRTPLIDSLLPFLPLTLVLSAGGGPHRALGSSPFSFDPLGLDDLTLRYPPSPTLTVCLLPWLRLVYLRLRLRLFHAVLGRRKRFRGLAGVFEEAAADDDDDLVGAHDGGDGDGDEAGAAARTTRTRGEALELVATLEVDVEERALPGAAAAHPAGAQQLPAAAAAAAADAPPTATTTTTTSRLRIGMGRLTSLVLGALVFPALSAAAGSALFWLAKRRGNNAPLRALRAVLGVGAVLAARGGAGPGSGSSSGAGTGLGASWIAQLAALGGGGSGGVGGTRRAATVVDPKWLRNTLGAALVLVVRDVCELTAGVLEQRRRRSRRVVERPFRPGMGSSGGAGGGAAAGQGGARGEGVAVSSGGRNAQGREAVVHTLL
ncbi:hypothetical protein JCM3775_000319 [Rhodotorula graminis]